MGITVIETRHLDVNFCKPNQSKGWNTFSLHPQNTQLLTSLSRLGLLDITNTPHILEEKPNLGLEAQKLKFAHTVKYFSGFLGKNIENRQITELYLYTSLDRNFFNKRQT